MMGAHFRDLGSRELVACAALGGEDIRRRVAHELDRRAAAALVQRILAAGRRPGAAAVVVPHAEATVAA